MLLTLFGRRVVGHRVRRRSYQDILALRKADELLADRHRRSGFAASAAWFEAAGVPLFTGYPDGIW